MEYTDDDDEEQICIYSPKYGFFSNDSISFDDHSILGSNYLQYKPEKIIFYTNETAIITGIQTWFRNVVNNNYINSGDNKGLGSKYKHIFIVKPKEYLSQCRIWGSKNNISKIYLETNLGNKFEIGINEGNEIPINSLNYGNKIIISFFGSYNKYLETFGFHIVEKKEYMKVMFTGYFELKKMLKNEDKRNFFIDLINKKELGVEDEAILRTCLLPNTPFNEIMKFCVF